MKKIHSPVIIIIIMMVICSCSMSNKENKTAAQWIKYENNPVLGGGDLGTVFDISVLKDDSGYNMYCSWRPKRSLALSTSQDGKNWSAPEIILGPNDANNWEEDINRPVVVLKDGIYHLWYTGQADGHSRIGYAISYDGFEFIRQSNEPVLEPEEDWEKVALMCPHVIWDEKENVFKMWYSGGEQYEPDAIGYATSLDGLNWTKYENNPVFMADPDNDWEKYKVTASQVLKRETDYLMFYIGFHDIDLAQIGMARSQNGIDSWERYSGNPIIFPTPGSWDESATYKPFAIPEEDRWMLWYNGRNENLEQIGLAIYPAENLQF